MFQLTKEEFDFLKSQIAMSNITDSQGNKNLKSQIAISRWGGTRKLPYAFTRNGVAMLSSVLRSQTAVGVNVKIMRVFTKSSKWQRGRRIVSYLTEVFRATQIQ